MNEPGPNMLPERCACGCEVYISLRPHAGMNEGACMAANGDEASIMNVEVIVILLASVS